MSPQGKVCPLCHRWFVLAISGDYVCPDICDNYHRDTMMAWGMGG